jgi:hypothetical protein
LNINNIHVEFSRESITWSALPNGLGFATRSLSLTPQLFANKPLDLLFHEGLVAEHCNRLKLGRTLDDAYTYGCDAWFQELALAVCAQEGIDQRLGYE